MDTRQASVSFYDERRERYVDYKTLMEDNKSIIEENLQFDDGVNQVISFHYKIMAEIELSGEYFGDIEDGAYLKVDVPIEHGFDYDFYHKIIILQDVSEETGCSIDDIIPIDKEEFDSFIEL